LGGYVKIAGMVDESMDKEQMKLPPKDYEFRSKPAWQRFLIMFAGVFMNVVLAFVIYIGQLSAYGEQYLPTSEVNKYGIHTDSLGQAFGLQDGDKILSVDGKYIDDFYRIPAEMILENAQTIEVERNGQKVSVELPDNAIAQLLEHQDMDFLSFRTPFVIYEFGDKSVAKEAGMLPKDIIIAINDIQTPYYQDFVSEIKTFKNQDIVLSAVRDKDTLQFAMRLPEEGVIGVYMAPINDYFELNTKDYSFIEAIPAGISKTMTGLSDYWKQLKLIFNPRTKAYESVGGFISIGKIFPDNFDWRSFWSLTAFLSIALAIMNILPIPALDGGHILFLLYEIITRRKPSDKFMQIAEVVGLVLIFGLVIFANGNDIIKLFR
jgi:RIP metalloprotease RseP